VLIDVWLFAVRGLGDTFRIVLDAPLALAIITPLTLVGACFHELGHATACRKGGARPGVIGVGLYLWWLVMFNDLTDTYRLDRRSRLRADLGGVYFNALFIVAIYVAYLATGFEPLLVVILVANFDIAAQFWPFVRLDGYYVISDLAGVPDLFPLIKPVLRYQDHRAGGTGSPGPAGGRGRVDHRLVGGGGGRMGSSLPHNHLLSDTSARAPIISACGPTSGSGACSSEGHFQRCLVAGLGCSGGLERALRAQARGLGSPKWPLTECS